MLRPTLDSTGFSVVPNVIPGEQIASLIAALERQFALADGALRLRGGNVYAVRNLLQLVPEVRLVAASTPVRTLIESVLGSAAFPVRSLLFDKTAEANWKVFWHQDVTIAVSKRIDFPGFGPWSTKAEVQHVEAPVGVLEKMLTLRIHLDACDESNGPLNVLPGSHTQGKLNEEMLQDWRRRTTSATCLAQSGDVLFMRPLLVHASSPAVKPAHRRVIQIEFTAGQLPGGLLWHGQ